jgi:hypothetical protein
MSICAVATLKNSETGNAESTRYAYCTALTTNLNQLVGIHNYGSPVYEFVWQANSSWGIGTASQPTSWMGEATLAASHSLV